MTYENNELLGYKLSELEPKPIKEFAEVARQMATEGMVLLKNENRILPVTENDNVAVFGRTQIDYYKSGTGSGGSVNVEYITNIPDSLIEGGMKINEELYGIYKDWAKENPVDMTNSWTLPWHQPEMPIDEEVVKKAAKTSNKALIIIGRTAGEGLDNTMEKGCCTLSELEEELCAKVTKYFDKVAVIMNVSNVIDMRFADLYGIGAILYAWQGGMEGGRATADVILGKVNPSGKLSDTITNSLEDHISLKSFGNPDRNVYYEDIYVGYRYFETFKKGCVKYPFGFGLSYSTFNFSEMKGSVEGKTVKVSVKITNTSDVPGKEVAQVYFSAPNGKLGRPESELCQFKKTKLLAPGESETLEMEFCLDDMAAYDDSGITGHKSAYVLEEGDYTVYIARDVRRKTAVLSYHVEKTYVTRQCTEALSPVRNFKRLKYSGNPEHPEAFEDVPKRSYDLKRRIREGMPAEIRQTEDLGIKLADVKSKKNTMDEFIAQLSDFDLACLVKGEGMHSEKVTPGLSGCFGGVTDRLLSYGIPIVATADGPSGLRMDDGTCATSMPIGTLLGCSFNPELIEKMHTFEGMEMVAFKVDVLLGPGINIHRVPLNGRNFEYYSEDPYLAGRVAIASVNGFRNAGVDCTIKHFYANAQEIKRDHHDSVLSERASREIYLKPFEMAVRGSDVRAIMTSYNFVNGIHTASSYDLNTVVLRGEWGFDGIVMTDWWSLKNEDVDCPESREDDRAMLQSQNDLYMVVQNSAAVASNIVDGLADRSYNRGAVQRCAKNICKFLMTTREFERAAERSGEFESTSELDISRMEKVAELSQNDGVYSFELEDGVRYAIAVEYSADENPLTQISVNALFDGNTRGLISARGTDGKTEIAAKELKLGAGAHKLAFKCNDEKFKLLSVTLYR
mgnify:CR=1 FL=1